MLVKSVTDNERVFEDVCREIILFCSALSAKNVTTLRPRTKRTRPTGLSLKSSVAAAGVIHRIEKINRDLGNAVPAGGLRPRDVGLKANSIHCRHDAGVPFRGMVSMVSMEVSKTLGPGSSPGTPARSPFGRK